MILKNPDMGITIILFYFISALIIVSSLLILFTRNIIYAVYLLVISFVGVAGIYVIAGAEFVAVTQIIIYAGGILILLIFGIMLTNRIGDGKVLTGSAHIIPGAVLGITLFFILVMSISKNHFTASMDGIDSVGNENTITQTIGIKLMTEYLLAFEIAGMLLLIALVGASFLANKNFGLKENDTH